MRRTSANSAQSFDYIIIGSGIMGLTLAHQLRERKAGQSILILEKEREVAAHASGRNSGVLHAGFYYGADSLKARFTILGNKIMREYCLKKQLPINSCGKLVVATNAEELTGLDELARRGKVNGAGTEMISANEAEKIEPNVKTLERALYSPQTATVDPIAICQALKDDLLQGGVSFEFDTAYRSRSGRIIHTSKGDFEAGRVINCAGLYADKIAKEYGFGKQYTIVPFKGLYLKYTLNKTDVKTNIYPVPDPRYPFLGVHFTKTVDGTIKIGPTAIPAFWRENYTFSSRFKLSELNSILFEEARLFVTNAFNFRELAFEEMRKYSRAYMIGLATKLVQKIAVDGFGEFTRPGIRAQLLNKQNLQLVQDFVVEGDNFSTHILNAVSPGFTCSFPFADYVIDKYLRIS